MALIRILPDGRSVPAREGRTILELVRQSGADIAATCGGKSECGECRVRVFPESALSPLDPRERELAGPEFRLACLAVVIREDKEITVEIPSRRHEILERGLGMERLFDPPVCTDGGMVVRDKQVLGPSEGGMYGLAFDAGTTTLVMRWLDLADLSCREMYSASMENPQVRFGGSVIDRVAYAVSRPGGEETLQGTIREAMNRMIDAGPVSPERIFEMVVVGNSVMRDLIIGHPVAGLGHAPFEPAGTGPESVPPSRLDIHMNPEGRIYAPPLIGHFVGADMNAVCLATNMAEATEYTMAVDIGTNTEIAVGNRDGIKVTSCASGPAFEGSGVACGSPAVGGAICTVRIAEDRGVRVRTIGGEPPRGICGSGLIDALAQMLERGIIDRNGRFGMPVKRFLLSGGSTPVYLNEEDIDAIRLAKAAVATGIRVLLDRSGIVPEDLARVYLAGAFGTYLDEESAVRIGMIPRFPPGTVVRVGNAAIEGAAALLCSSRLRDRIVARSQLFSHVSLEAVPDFYDRFVAELPFP